MHYSPILAPVVALVAWSLAMQVWMYVTRFSAMRKAGISLKGRVGTRGSALEGAIPVPEPREFLCRPFPEADRVGSGVVEPPPHEGIHRGGG
jgi:hypothetical protein